MAVQDARARTVAVAHSWPIEANDAMLWARRSIKLLRTRFRSCAAPDHARRGGIAPFALGKDADRRSISFRCHTKRDVAEDQNDESGQKISSTDSVVLCSRWRVLPRISGAEPAKMADAHSAPSL